MPDLDYGLAQGARIISDDTGTIRSSRFPLALSDILVDVAGVLMDKSHVRWPLADLCRYVDEALKQIAIHKPNELATSVEMVLLPGAFQTLGPDHVRVLRFTRNLATLTQEDGPARVGRGAITLVSRRMLDAFNPDWTDTDVITRTTLVKHAIYDEATPRNFLVYPPNDGTGVIEADVVPILPPCELTPDTTTAAEQLHRINCSEIMAPVIRDYVLYRAYEIDDEEAASAQKSLKHFQMFAQALGLKANGEALNPNSYRQSRRT